jgi:hypothetical protein
MKDQRKELLAVLAELSQHDSDLRFGQMVANLAALAQGAKVEAIWEAEDDELLTAARRLLANYHSRKANVA